MAVGDGVEKLAVGRLPQAVVVITGRAVEAVLLSGFAATGPLFSATMFDIVKPQITTAADKLTHLRRFL